MQLEQSLFTKKKYLKKTKTNIEHFDQHRIQMRKDITLESNDKIENECIFDGKCIRRILLHSFVNVIRYMNVVILNLKIFKFLTYF